MEEFIGKNKVWGNPAFIKAKDIMLRHPYQISASRTVLQAMQVMKHNSVDSVLITSGKKLEGIVWLEDLQNLGKYSASLMDFISHNYEWVYDDTTLQEIIDLSLIHIFLAGFSFPLFSWGGNKRL